MFIRRNTKGEVLNEGDTEVYWHDISQKSSEFNKYLVDNSSDSEEDDSVDNNEDSEADEVLKIWQKICTFLNILNENLMTKSDAIQEKYRPLGRYCRLVNRTCPSRTAILEKHINVFYNFCRDNFIAIKDRRLDKLEVYIIKYSNICYVNILELLTNIEFDPEYIWDTLNRFLVYATSTDVRGTAASITSIYNDASGTPDSSVEGSRLSQIKYSLFDKVNLGNDLSKFFKPDGCLNMEVATSKINSDSDLFKFFKPDGCLYMEDVTNKVTDSDLPKFFKPDGSLNINEVADKLVNILPPSLSQHLEAFKKKCADPYNPIAIFMNKYTLNNINTTTICKDDGTLDMAWLSNEYGKVLEEEANYQKKTN